MSLEALVEEFFSNGKKAAGSKEEKELHAFRIAARRLRYTIEILDPKGAGEWLRRLKILQEHLGQMNDAFVAERYLRNLPSRSTQARTLPSKLHAEALNHISKFQSTWCRRFGPRTEKAWLTWARQLEE